MKRMKNTKRNQEEIKGNYKEFRFHIHILHATCNIKHTTYIYKYKYKCIHIYFFQAKLTC